MGWQEWVTGGGIATILTLGGRGVGWLMKNHAKDGERAYTEMKEDRDRWRTKAEEMTNRELAQVTELKKEIERQNQLIADTIRKATKP